MLQLAVKSNEPEVHDLIKGAILSEIKKLKCSLYKTENILKEFELKYQISSDFFLQNWTAENLSDGDEEYISWLGEIKFREKLIIDLERLEAIEYVAY